MAVSHAPHPRVGKPGPFGFWKTLGLGVVIVMAFLLAQVLVAVAFAIIWKGRLDIQSVGVDGLLMALAVLISAPVAVGLVLLMVRRRPGMSVRAYLALYPISPGQALRWALLVVGLAMAWNLLTAALGRPVIPHFMVELYRNAESLPLLWVAVVVAAPIAEETVFRGFIFKGFRHSPLGPTGATILTALAWAALHLQYDLYGIVTVFGAGLLLGAARHLTHSLYAPLLMHALWSFIALTEVAVHVQRTG